MRMRQILGILLALSLLLTCAQAFAAPEDRTYQVVLLRHGQSYMNLADVYSGWSDAHLTERGISAALDVGRLMREEGLSFDAVHTSYLSRAIKTAWLALEGMDMMWVPVHTHWRLNETNYGYFEGLGDPEMLAVWDEERILEWEASFDIAPPPLPINDPRSPLNDVRYSGIENLPEAESLADTLERARVHWDEVLLPAIKSGQNIMIVGHANGLRAISKLIDDTLDTSTLKQLRIGNTEPIIFTLDADFRPIDRRVLTLPAN